MIWKKFFNIFCKLFLIYHTKCFRNDFVMRQVWRLFYISYCCFTSAPFFFLFLRHFFIQILTLGNISIQKQNFCFELKHYLFFSCITPSHSLINLENWNSLQFFLKHTVFFSYLVLYTHFAGNSLINLSIDPFFIIRDSSTLTDLAVDKLTMP